MTRIIDQLPPQLRAIAGVLLGVGLGFGTMTLLKMVLPFRPPEGVDITQSAAYNEWVGGLPTAGYLSMLGTFLVAAFVAGVVCGYFVLGTPYRVGVLLSGFLLLVLTIGNFLAFNHPEWLTYSASIGFVVFAWLGGALVRKLANQP